MGYKIEAETKEYSPTHWQFHYIMSICTLNKRSIAQILEIPKELALKWGEDRKILSIDEIVNKTEIKYIDNINKNFGKLLDIEVKHLKERLKNLTTISQVKEKQINKMKRIVGKTKYKEIYEKSKKEVGTERPAAVIRREIDMSKLKRKKDKSDD